jgi:hypothetical protein
MSEFFRSPFRIRQIRAGQHGPLLDGFIQELQQAGFAEVTARGHIRAAEHLLHWANRKVIAPLTFNEDTVAEFVQHLRRCRCKGFGHRHHRELQAGARLFIGSLRRAGLVPPVATQGAFEDSPMLELFCDWMRKNRSTSDATLFNYRRPLRALLTILGDDVRRFEARGLWQFVQDVSQHGGWATGKQCITAGARSCATS